MSNTENLVLELLRAIRGDVATLRDDVREVKHRLSNIEGSLATVKTELGHQAAVDAQQNMTFDRIVERIETIERRLELS